MLEGHTRLQSTAHFEECSLGLWSYLNIQLFWFYLDNPDFARPIPLFTIKAILPLKKDKRKLSGSL